MVFNKSKLKVSVCLRIRKVDEGTICNIIILLWNTRFLIMT